MVNDDLNRFLKTFFYPILNLELIYDEDFEKFYEYSSEIEGTKLKERKDYRENIRKKAIKHLRQKNNISSYDMVYQYLEKWYLSDEKIEGSKNFKKKNFQEQENIELFDVIFENLRLLSKCLISKLDDKIIYKYWENENDKKILCGFSGKNKIHLYRALNQIVPTDILVVLFAISSENKEKVLENFFGNIAVTDLALESVLQKGVAENHLHLGVTLNFSLTWNELVKEEIKKGESKDNFFKEFEHTCR
ncbi:MAG: hypothetical protein K2L15_02120, partial [Eubacteriales bacterium]|nr:hypothetical protein [Eubacteriales bacterium]